MKEKIFEFIKKKYKVLPEYLWEKFPEYAVFRHTDNRKWFALQASVPGDKLGLKGDEPIEIINLKVNDMLFRDLLVQQAGIIPAYHMNKQHWITVFLDGTVPEQQIFDLIDSSFLATASNKKSKGK